ncbi:MAG TPA: putative Ig domain-containing protein [Gammaproteobacteria bacterium]
MNVPAFRKRALSILLSVGIAGLALSAAGCGGDEEAAAAADPPPSGGSPPPSGGGNRAPTISGTPATSITQGTAYSFAPTASDPDGNTLTFSVTNLPAWATFNTSTGRISGTPSAAQVGAYANIRVSVSDGSMSANLAPFSIQVVATATGQALLSWTPPTQNTDGSPLTNLAGYRVYWGLTPGSYANSVTVNNPGIATYVVDQLTPAQWYFAVTALSSTGAESGYSNVGSKQVL